MSNVQRYRSGSQDVVTGIIEAGSLAEIGDLVALVSGYVVPASEFTDSQTTNFHDVFLGVLIEGATIGTETYNTNCVVAVTGEYEFDCAALAQAYAPGQAFGAADGGATLADQTVAPTLATTEAVGKLSRQARVGDTTVTLRIRSVVMEQAYGS